jgi:glycosidase
LSPVALNGPGTYHGYAPRHFMAVDPRLGTLADLQRLVDRAHKHGIRIVLDLVLNHAGPVFEYAGGSNLWTGAAEAGEIQEGQIAVLPLELASSQHFSRRGVIDDWNDAEQETLGDFPPDYRRLATERPETQELLQYIACWWIKETDIDGIRLDAIRHMDRSFVRRFCRAIKSYAGYLGKNNFLIVGEHASSDDTLIAACFEAGVDAVYNYGEYRRQSLALHGRAPTRELAESFRIASTAFGYYHGRTIRFIDNHDVYRFLRDGEPEGRLRVALAFLILSIGIPMLYYGTEQAFRQSTQRLDHENIEDPADPGNREDMFLEGGFTTSSSIGDKFDRSSSIFNWTRRLIEIRQSHTALHLGSQEILFSDRGRPGFYAFIRRHNNECVLVVLNTSSRYLSQRVPIGAFPIDENSCLHDILHARRAATMRRTKTGLGVVNLTLPPFGVVILVPSEESQERSGDRPEVPGRRGR